MRYVSTRGEAPSLGFRDAVLAGLARDGGLYVPESWPQFSSDELRAWRRLPYPELALRILSPFVGGEIPQAEFERLVREAYATFRHPAVCPLVQLGHQPSGAGAFPWPDAGLQGRGHAAARPADRPHPGRERRPCDDRRGDLGRYRRGGSRIGQLGARTIASEELLDLSHHVLKGPALVAGDLAEEEVVRLDRGGAFVQRVDLLRRGCTARSGSPAEARATEELQRFRQSTRRPSRSRSP